jgi:hypothetical protein
MTDQAAEPPIKVTASMSPAAVLLLGQIAASPGLTSLELAAKLPRDFWPSDRMPTVEYLEIVAAKLLGRFATCTGDQDRVWNVTDHGRKFLLLLQTRWHLATALEPGRAVGLSRRSLVHLVGTVDRQETDGDILTLVITWQAADGKRLRQPCQETIQVTLAGVEYFLEPVIYPGSIGFTLRRGDPELILTGPGGKLAEELRDAGVVISAGP